MADLDNLETELNKRLLAEAHDLFGFIIRNPEREKREKDLKTFAGPELDDGALITSFGGGLYQSYIDFSSRDLAATEIGLINKYREMSINTECDRAIQSVLNEMIVMNDDGGPVDLLLDETGLKEPIKKKILEQFEGILEMLDFKHKAYDIARKWYVDGRIYYHLMIDEKDITKGIQDVRFVDPRKIKKVKELQDHPANASSVDPFKQVYEEYFMYNDAGIDKTGEGLRIARDSVAYVTSGMVDTNTGLVLGHMHKSIKPFNQLRMIEDAKLIYVLARAPERRIFYIDVAGMTTTSSEKYLNNVAQRMKNKIQYNISTGEIINERNFMTMLEDFFLPQRDGKGTNVETLSGGQGLGEMDEVEYFRRKLYEALNVPTSRLESDTMFNVGRSSEINRDEVHFSYFIERMRNQFSDLFNQMLEKQVVLKKIVTLEEWQAIERKLNYDWQIDNHFAELKDLEIMEGRFNTLALAAEALEHKMISKTWARREILRQSEEEMEELDAQIKEEEKIAGEDVGDEYGDDGGGFGDEDDAGFGNKPMDDFNTAGSFKEKPPPKEKQNGDARSESNIMEEVEQFLGLDVGKQKPRKHRKR